MASTKQKPEANPPADPFRAVSERVADLEAAVSVLPFSGTDQRNKAAELVAKLGEELRTVLVLDDPSDRTVVRRAGERFETTAIAPAAEER